MVRYGIAASGGAVAVGDVGVDGGGVHGVIDRGERVQAGLKYESTWRIARERYVTAN